MPRVYVIDFQDSEGDHLPLIEFAYTNGYRLNM